MTKVITSPVELGFSEFVSKLISDTFDAVITSSITQEENWNQLNRLLSLTMDDFAEQVIDNDMIQMELISLFPDGSGSTAIVNGAAYTRANPRKETPENPPVKTVLGYEPKGDKLTEKDVAEIGAIVKNLLAERQFEVLNRVFSRGSTKIIVDAGKINAKLNFEILQVEESDNDSNDNTSVAVKKIFVRQKYPGFSSLGRPIELKNVHLFVKPPADSDPQTHQVKANVYGEVEIQFKTIS
jgi:hypothetical protein